MALTEQQIIDAAIIKYSMIDGEQTTLRSADEIIKLDAYATQKANACDQTAKQRLFKNVFGMKLRSKDFPSS